MAEEKKKVLTNAEKRAKRETKIKILKIGLLVSALFLIIIYFILRVIYEQGAFTISLDQNFAKKSGVVIYEKMETKESKRVLEAEKLEFIDNISINWLPKDLDKSSEGSHNGENYIAYTFYVENQGSQDVNYWYSILVDDVIKNIDNAIRVMVYQNGVNTVYAKMASNGNPESGTTPFYSNNIVLMEQRKDFTPGTVDKYTVVIWIEGDDPDCIDALIGGEMKMHLEITEEHKGQ